MAHDWVDDVEVIPRYGGWTIRITMWCGDAPARCRHVALFNEYRDAGVAQQAAIQLAKRIGPHLKHIGVHRGNTVLNVRL